MTVPSSQSRREGNRFPVPGTRRYWRRSSFPLATDIPAATSCPFSARAEKALVLIAQWYDTFRRANAQSEAAYGFRLPTAVYYFWYAQWARRLFSGPAEQFRSPVDLKNLAIILQQLDSVAGGYFGRALDT